MRLCSQCDSLHLGRRGHFEIERFWDFGLQPRHVGIANVAPILAQMRGDAVDTGIDRRKRNAHRIGPRAASRVAQGGDVIDIESKTDRGRMGHGKNRRLSRPDSTGAPIFFGWMGRRVKPGH
jgi:hypothetical protein